MRFYIHTLTGYNVYDRTLGIRFYPLNNEYMKLRLCFIWAHIIFGVRPKV